MTSTAKQIVAGYDGSPDSDQALDWAVREARLHDAALTVCHAWTPASALGLGDGSAEAEQLLAEGVRRARTGRGCGEVRPLLAEGPAASELCRLGSSGDTMVVVGSRGRGGLEGLLLGSVSLQVATCSTGLVTVVRGHWQPVVGQAQAPVVVGADGSGASQAAVEFAFDEAARYGAPLVAVCALADSAGVLGSARQVEAEFDQALAKCEPDYPQVPVERVVRQGAPREALLEAASRAQLLVVGARGRGGLQQMMLGSVALTMLHHAPCPVTVTR